MIFEVYYIIGGLHQSEVKTKLIFAEDMYQAIRLVETSPHIVVLYVKEKINSEQMTEFQTAVKEYEDKRRKFAVKTMIER